ncbi:MAG: hypothetical protein DLM50_03875 [Candidatus Meridianibacter frigidus]|nr:MAG: hypothetical protein DLM50_03875 [Candidatus Eremiobacteraeota bacterium]
MIKFLGVLLACALSAALTLPAEADQQEQQIGQQVYQQLQQKGEIITSSPYYAILNPIGNRIKRVADAQYDAPFHFILVHESQPNAFAVPGGNVYVTDSMMSFAQNKEELAGVLCHETSHTIHHDVVHLAQKQQYLDLGANILSALLGGGNVTNFILGTTDQLFGLRFSRGVEESADHTGAITCAQAGINPWGMVWLFKNFEAKGGGHIEALSDHPTDQHRISLLQDEFSSDPALFARFSSNIATATPIMAAGFHTAAPAAYRSASAKAAAAAKRKHSATRSAAYCCAPH